MPLMGTFVWEARTEYAPRGRNTSGAPHITATEFFLSPAQLTTMPPQAEIFAQVARLSVPDGESGGVSAAGSSDGSFVDACRDAATAVKIYRIYLHCCAAAGGKILHVVGPVRWTSHIFTYSKVALWCSLLSKP